MMDYVIEIYKQLNPEKEVPEVCTDTGYYHCRTYNLPNIFFILSKIDIRK